MDLKTINKLHRMLSSEDSEMVDLGVSICDKELVHPFDGLDKDKVSLDFKVTMYKSELELMAYRIGHEHALKLLDGEYVKRSVHFEADPPSKQQ